MPKDSKIKKVLCSKTKWKEEFDVSNYKKGTTESNCHENGVEAPLVAKKAKAGQFIILRVHEDGERIPLTIADYDRQAQTVTIIFQVVGRTTKLLDQLNEGDEILDFVGPLGKPSEVEGFKKVCVVGGGVGCAIAYPTAKALLKTVLK